MIGENIRRLREEAGLNQRELAKKSGVSHSYISDVERGTVTPSIKFLEKIAKALGVRSTVLLNKKEAEWEVVSVPILGSVPAGSPFAEEEQIIGYMPFPKVFIDGQVFCLKINGDSMQDMGIEDGDYILVKAQNEAQNGQTIVARIQNEVTIKRFYKIDGKVRLEPANIRYRAIEPGEVEIIGIVKKVIKDVR